MKGKVRRNTTLLTNFLSFSHLYVIEKQIFQLNLRRSLRPPFFILL